MIKHLLILLGCSIWCTHIWAYPVLNCEVIYYSQKTQNWISCGSVTLGDLASGKKEPGYSHGPGKCKDVTLLMGHFGDNGDGSGDRNDFLVVAHTTKKYENDQPSWLTFPENYPPRFQIMPYFSARNYEVRCRTTEVAKKESP